MGYTHYAYIPTGRIQDAQWSYLQNQIMGLTLANDWQEKDVILTADLIQVKGNREWFVIPRECSDSLGGPTPTHFNFTKTVRMPYDYIVVACYMALYRAVDGVKLSSDGDWHELADGRQHYANTFGLSDAGIQELFTDTIHDERPEWYIGDPHHAIHEYQWDDFIGYTTKQIETKKYTRTYALEGNGVELEWKGYKVYLYNSGLGGDGSVNVHGHKLSIDTGMLSVLPIAVCNGDMNGGSFVRSFMRPVFHIDTDNFPHVTLTLEGYTAHDDMGKVECDGCDERWDDNDMQTDANGSNLCFECYEEVEEGVDA